MLTNTSVEFNSASLLQQLSGVVLRDANAGDSHYAGGIDDNGFLAIYRRNGGLYTMLANGTEFPTSGVHTVSLTATGTDPVQLSLKLDGLEYISYADASTSRIVYPGRAGMFSSGIGQDFSRFDVFGDVILTIAQPPVLAEIPPQTAAVGVTKVISFLATDVNGGTLTFSGSGLPGDATVKSYSITLPNVPGYHGDRRLNFGVFSWTPTSTETGPFYPTITVTDSTSRFDSQQVTITVPSSSTSCSPIKHFLNASPEPTPDPLKTFYVHGGTPGNDGNVGSEAAPLKTIRMAICKVKGGGCLGVETGTGPGSAVVILRNLNGTVDVPYEESLFFEDLAGTPEAPIWIGGKLGNPPLISDYRANAEDSNEVLQLVRPKYIVLHDMTIGRDVGHTRSHGMNLEDGGDYNNVEAAHHVIIQRVHFKNIGHGVSVQSCIKSSGLNHFWILDNTFNYCGRGRDTPATETTPKISRGGWGVNADGCHDGVIAENNFTGRTFVLTKGGSRNIEIRQNTSTVHLRTNLDDLDNDIENDDNADSYQLGGRMDVDKFRPKLMGTHGVDTFGDPDGLYYEARHSRLIGNVITGGTGIRFEGCYQCLVANNTIIDPVENLFYITQASGSLGELELKGDQAKFVSEGRVFNNIFYFSAPEGTPAIKRARLDNYVKTTPNRWKTFQFNGNLYCNKSNLNTCAPDAEPFEDGPSGDLTPEDVNGWQGLDAECDPLLIGASCNPQFAPADTYGYPIKTNTPPWQSGVSLTASSPNSVLEYTGYVLPAGFTTPTVEDRAGVCYATKPSRGAREVP